MASTAIPMPVMPTEKAVAHTSFWVGTNVMVLFPGWPGYYSLLHYYLALLLVFVLALLTPICGMCPMPANPQMVPMTLLLYALRHGLRKCLFYLVVLSVVTFNVGVFLAAIAGHVIGYSRSPHVCSITIALQLIQKSDGPGTKFCVFHSSRSYTYINRTCGDDLRGGFGIPPEQNTMHVASTSDSCYFYTSFIVDYGICY